VLRVRRLRLEGAEPAEAETAIESLARHLGASDIDLDRSAIEVSR
jgi:hypothetical protein